MPRTWWSGSRRSCWYTATAGDGEGREHRAGEGAMLEPELASAPDRGLDAQPVLVPDRGLDGLAVKRRTALSLGARGESRGPRE